MKKSSLTILILIIGFFVGTLVITGCGSDKKAETREQEGEDHEHEHDETIVYACPMHPEVTGKEGEKCSKCGMRLERVKSTDSTRMEDGHQH